MQIFFNNVVLLGVYYISSVPQQTLKTSGSGVYYDRIREPSKTICYECEELSSSRFLIMSNIPKA